MNIGMLTATLKGGGAEKVVATLSLFFQKVGFNSIIILFKKEIAYPYAGKVCSLDTKIEWRAILISRVLTFLQRYFRLKKILKQEKLDVLLCVGEAANKLGLLTHKNAITSTHNIISISEKFIPLKKKLMTSFIYPRIKKAIAVSDAIKSDLTHHFGIPAKKITTIYNPIDIDFIRREAQKPLPKPFAHLNAIANNNNIILSVGSLTHQKGQKYLLSLFKEVVHKNPNLHLILLGEGGEKDELMQMTNQLGIQKNVLFAGFVNNPYVFMTKATLLLMTSRYEGNPNVVWESLACNLPVVFANTKENIPQEQKDFFQLNDDYITLLPCVPDNEPLDKQAQWCRQASDIVLKRLSVLQSRSQKIDTYKKIVQLKPKNIAQKYIEVFQNSLAS